MYSHKGEKERGEKGKGESEVGREGERERGNAAVREGNRLSILVLHKQALLS